MISFTNFFVLSFLVVVNLQMILGKPFFGDRLMCDFLCEDEDGVARTVDPDDMWDVYCNGCPTRRPRVRTSTPFPLPPNALVPIMPNNMRPNFPNNFPRGMRGGPPMGFVIYPSTGMNVTMTPTDGFYTWSFMPWTTQQNQQTTTSSPTMAAATTPTPTAASAATEAPAASTIAPAAATTAKK